MFQKLIVLLYFLIEPTAKIEVFLTEYTPLLALLELLLLGAGPPFKLTGRNEIPRIIISICVIGSPITLFHLFALRTMKAANTAGDFLIEGSHLFECLSVR